MVTIVGYKSQVNAEGKPFIALELQSELVMVQSSESGKFYATSKKCSITSTFDETTAKSLIGKELSGRIEKVGCEEYEYTTEEGEIILLSHRWEYLPEGEPKPLRVITSELAVA